MENKIKKLELQTDLIRKFGKTDINIFLLGFGALRFEEPRNIEKSIKTVLKAVEIGVNYFDTAPLYCDDMSETIIGEAVKKLKKMKKKVYISTKSFKNTAGELRKDLEKSLSVLNIDCIDFYNIWRIMSYEDYKNRERQGVIKEILKAREEGLISHVCFSSHAEGTDIEKIIKECPFEGVTLGYSVINFPYRERGIEAANNKDIATIIMNPLGGGIIPQNAAMFDFLKITPEQTILETALHFLMQNKKITSILVGFRNENDVITAYKAITSFKKYKTYYTNESIEHLKSKIQSGFNKLCTTCKYCNICPENIQVWAFMETYNHLILKNKISITNWLKDYWNIFDFSILKKCSKCLKCEKRCTQHLPIMERFDKLKEVLKI